MAAGFHGVWTDRESSHLDTPSQTIAAVLREQLIKLFAGKKKRKEKNLIYGLNEQLLCVIK